MAWGEGRSGDTRGELAVVVDSRDTWQEQGRLLAAEVQGLLGERALRVEHIGSTAVPRMAAKDVIDLQVGVAHLDGLEGVFGPALEENGFLLSPARRDHVPAGSDDDPELWVKRLWTRRRHVGADVNLHVRVAGSPGERLALLFRDWFRAHPEAVPAYARFKAVLAGAVADIGAYSEVKDPVVDLVVRVAVEWAAGAGWKP
jgi:GrpB-like predicted nucleotidyltransferase (UPF0157 family)